MEFRNLLELYESKAAECDTFVAAVLAGQRQATRADLKLLWQTDLLPASQDGGRPVEAESLFPTVPQPTERALPPLPRSRTAAKRWLRDQAVALSPNARGRFSRELEPILDFLFDELKDEAVRDGALRDLRERLRNEETKIFNNFKSEQVVKSLRRQWSRRDGVTRR